MLPLVVSAHDQLRLPFKSWLDCLFQLKSLLIRSASRDPQLLLLLLPFSDVQPRLPFPVSVFPVAGPSLVQPSLFFPFAPVQALVSLLKAIVLLVKLRLF